MAKKQNEVEVKEFDMADALNAEVDEAVKEALDISKYAKNAKNTTVYTLSDGSETFKQAVKIRDMFMNELKTRNQIVEELEVPYRAVYAATINMDNGVTPERKVREKKEGGTRTASQSRIVLRQAEDGSILSCKDVEIGDQGETQPMFFANGVQLENAEEAEALWTASPQVDVKVVINALVAEGYTRSEIAKITGLAYGTVFSYTKGADVKGAGGGIQKKMYDVDGEQLTQTAYIKKLADEGMSKGEIAKTLEIAYGTVFQALSKSKEASTAYAQKVVAGLAKKFGPQEVIDNIVGLLANLEPKAETNEEAEVVADNGTDAE